MPSTIQPHAVQQHPSPYPRPPSPDTSRDLAITSSSSIAPVPPPAPPLPPPPAPPLPSQRYVQRAANAFGRLAHPFLYGSRPSSAQGHRDGARRTTGLRSSVRRSSSPVSSRSAAHKTGIPIAAFDISPERTHAVLAGRDILKTIKIADATCTEEFNLRSKLSAYASAHNASRDAVSAQHRDQLAANDVKWSLGNFSTTIATAAANGRIVIYDLNRPSVEIGRLHEHSRQVHRIAFNPHQGALLISGSQDGTVRMWDMRKLNSDRAVRVTGSINRFYCHADSVRDLRWSPTDGVEFAVGTDSGVIQRWDFRRENAPILKLNAHDKTCMTLDWHPGGRYLASGGADKLIKVWDFRSSDRRMKPQWQLRAPQAVSKIRWRPSAGGGDESQDHRQVTSLAASYDGKDPRVHIWDFRRPHAPFQEIDRYDSAPTDLLWRSGELLWSVNSAGVFTQADLKFATTPLDRMNVNVLAAGPDANFFHFSEHRAKKQIAIAEAAEQFLNGGDSQGSSGEKLQPSSDPTNPGGDDSLALSSSLKRRRQRFASTRPPSHASVANSATDSEAKISDKNLLDSFYRSTQISASGRILGVFDANSFQTLAGSYSLPSWPKRAANTSIIEAVRGSFDHNAMLAAKTGQYRLAQTWSVIGHAACTELRLRLEAAALSESQKKSGVRWVDEKPNDHAKARAWIRGAKPPALTSPRETTSSVATPLARPIRGKSSISSLDAHALEPEPKPSKISFVAPAWEAPASSSPEKDTEPAAQSARDTHGGGVYKPEPDNYSPSFEFPDLERQMQERRDAMNNYRARPRSLLRLDNPSEDSRTPLPIPVLDRHDSTESLQMFAGSQDSDPRSVPFTGSFEDSRKSDVSVSFGSREYADEPHSRVIEPVQRKLSAGLLDPVAQSTSAQSPFPSSFNHVSPSAHEEPEVVGSFQEGGFAPVQRPSTQLEPNILISRAAFGKRDGGPSPDDPWVLFDDSAELRENPAPWTLPALLPPLIEYHLDTLSDTQLPSIVTLALYPFFPSLFDPVARSEAYLLAYHELLASLKLSRDAAALRKAWHPHFPELASEATAEQGRGTGKDRAALWCVECGRPVKGDTLGWCQRCCTEWGPCGVCELPDPPSLADLGMVEDGRNDHAIDMALEEVFMTVPEASQPTPKLQSKTARDTRLWHWCQGCGHGGHAICIRAWWRAAGRPARAAKDDESATAVDISDLDMSEGACPIAGCEHDCVSSARRAARLRTLERRRSRTATPVARDDWVASESRAVGSATRSLVSDGSNSASGAALSGGGNTGPVSASAGSSASSAPATARSVAGSNSSRGGASGSGATKGGRGKGDGGRNAGPGRRGGDGGAFAARRRGSGPGKFGTASSLESSPSFGATGNGNASRENAGREAVSFGTDRSMRRSFEQVDRGGGRRVRLAVPPEVDDEMDLQRRRGASEPL